MSNFWKNFESHIILWLPIYFENIFKKYLKKFKKSGISLGKPSKITYWPADHFGWTSCITFWLKIQSSLYSSAEKLILCSRLISSQLKSDQNKNSATNLLAGLIQPPIDDRLNLLSQLLVAGWKILWQSNLFSQRVLVAGWKILRHLNLVVGWKILYLIYISS